VPAGAVHEDDGVGAAGDGAADLIQMHLHGGDVGARQHEGGANAALRADGAEQVGVLVSLISRQGRTCAGPGPDAGAAVLLAEPGFILEPDLDRPALRQAAYVGLERAREVFLKASSTRASWPGCFGRPLM
jgi:hypothetical protein